MAPKRAYEANEPDIVLYISSMFDRNLTAGTVHRKYFAVRSFFQFLKRKRIRSTDPTDGIPFPRNRTPGCCRP
jgi:site-specific recombinase XerD